MGNGQSTSSLRTCLDNVCQSRPGCVAYSGDLLYQMAWVKPYNLAYNSVPQAVIRPRNAQDVSAIIACAAANAGVPVQARSGGHSYGNYGMAHGGVEIDLVNMQGFSMDTKTWNAKIGSGTKLGEVSKKLHNAGGRAMAHGVCPGVGIGGHATIGGLGPMSRMWGSALDHVIEVEVVTSDGKIQRANETYNADLFWGLKGAGASFGVITEFVVKTHPEPGHVVQYSYTFSFGRQADMAPVYQNWQAVIADPNLDRRFASMFILQPLGALITGTFYGTEAEFKATGIPARLPKGGAFSVVLNDWIGGLAHEAENEGLALSDIPTPFYSKSLAFRQQDLLPPASVKELFNYLDKADKGTLLWFIIFDQSGGAVSDIPHNANAYAHRDKLLFYQSYAIGIPSVSPATRNFLTGVHDRIKAASKLDSTQASTYAGYVDPGMTTPGPMDAMYAYWGKDKADRLQALKAKWDPKNVFHNPQSVLPIGGGPGKKAWRRFLRI